MMKVTTKELKKLIAVPFPALKFVWLSDQTYILPSKEEIETAIKLNTVKEEYPYIPGIGECDDYALQLLAHIRSWRWKKATGSEKRPNWAIGLCSGDRYGILKDDIHWCNIAITPEAIHIIEPQDDSMVIANPNVFKPFMVYM